MISSSLELDPLTGRESDVLRLMSTGKSNPQIAKELVVSVETVRWYTKQIYSKLGVHSRTQAVLRSQELGMFAPVARPAKAAKSPPPLVLPHYATPFIGREKELKEIGNLLARPEVRLVTIAGPGGSGKTRLCIEVARRWRSLFPGGVFFVSLAPLKAVTDLAPAVARALGLHLNDKDDPQQQLTRWLRDRPVLLVLDNLEHLPGGAAWVSAYLAATRHPKLLVSSHTSLNISAEWVRYLGGMAYPGREDTLEMAHEVEAYPAVQLFIERARRVSAGFDPVENRACVVQICRLLQGFPLALELAAGWLKSLPCPAIVAEIRDGTGRLDSRQADRADRHHSLEAVFAYSWPLLTPEEQRVMLRLSLFRGGFSLLTAEQVAGATLLILTGLVDKSFLTLDPAGNFHIHELLRHFAAGRLEQKAPDLLTTRTSRLLLWSLFVKGDFTRAAQLAGEVLARSAPNTLEQAFGLALTGILAGIEEDYHRCRELCTAAHDLVQMAVNDPDPVTAIFTRVGMAITACGQDDYAQLRRHVTPALGQARTMRSPAFTLLCLPLLAIQLAHEAEPEQAVRLLSLTFNHPAHTAAWLEKWPLLTRLQQDLAVELAEGQYTALWAAGRALDLNRVEDWLPAG
jgi:predicted ATPase/DNA-binding CsgD family transcriptional regulator